MREREQLIAAIVQEVVQRLQPQLAAQGEPAEPVRSTGGNDGVFPTTDEAVQAAGETQPAVAGLSLDERGEIINVIRRICEEKADEWGRMELAESKIGRLDHKIKKLESIREVLGVEVMRTVPARTDASGMCLIERAPWGVIGMVLPATHSVPTLAANAISIIAAGNTAVFSPHPAAAKSASHALQVFNREIEKLSGIRNILCTPESASIKTAEEVFYHPGIALLCVTGGPGVVRAAMKAGKRVIAAGPGNPPVVVDETADLNQAARDIIEGGAFDNNLLCISEKEIFVVAQVADAFVAAMKRAGAIQLNSGQIERLTQAAFTFSTKGAGCGRAHLKRDLVGKDPEVLARAAGLPSIPSGAQLLFGETPEEHAFVQEEQMMPFVPVVRVSDIDAAIQAALKAEHGYRHTAIIHSRNVHNVTKMARAMNTTLFVHNAPCTAGLGVDGPGYLSYSIATPTGEGVTTPLTFTRERQIVVGKALRIV